MMVTNESKSKSEITAFETSKRDSKSVASICGDRASLPSENVVAPSGSSVSSSNCAQSSSEESVNQGGETASALEMSESRNKRGRDEDGMEEERLEERRAKNRLSAHQSRLRKMRQLKYMQTQVVLLSEENNTLMETNQRLVTELAKARTENANLRLLCQDVSQVMNALQTTQGMPPGAFPF